MQCISTLHSELILVDQFKKIYSTVNRTEYSPVIKFCRITCDSQSDAGSAPSENWYRDPTLITDQLNLQL